MPTPSGRRPPRDSRLTDALTRADLAAEFLRRNRTYRADHAQMNARIERGTLTSGAAEAAFARRWGLSFRRVAR